MVRRSLTDCMPPTSASVDVTFSKAHASPSGFSSTSTSPSTAPGFTNAGAGPPTCFSAFFQSKFSGSAPSGEAGASCPSPASPADAPPCSFPFSAVCGKASGCIVTIAGMSASSEAGAAGADGAGSSGAGRGSASYEAGAAGSGSAAVGPSTAGAEASGTPRALRMRAETRSLCGSTARTTARWETASAPLPSAMRSSARCSRRAWSSGRCSMIDVRESMRGFVML